MTPKPEAREALARHDPTPASEPVRLQAALLDQEWEALVLAGTAAAGRGQSTVQAFVHQLFTALDRLAPEDRVAVVLAFFESGKDVYFGSGFSIGSDGFLQNWPTMRVAFFDYIAQRDGHAARGLAERLLQKRRDQPGEWTLAFRELTRGKGTDSWTPLVVERLHEFLTDPDWGAKSERSWLEGFDVVVASRSPSYLPDLSALTVEERVSRAARFAAFLAADRLMLSAPVEVLSALNHDPTLFVSEPNVRAGLFARADVRQSEQLRELEAYFSRTDIADSERENFAALFPLYDLAVSQNLLTRSGTRSMTDMLAHDRATITLLEEWMADSRWDVWRPSMRKIQVRLEEQLTNADSK